MKILLNTPDINLNGGVANHYLGLKDKFNINIIYNYIGERSKQKLFLWNQLKDYWKFSKIVFKEKPNIVHLNPSLDFKGVIRDAVFLIISKLLNNKTIVFWHGWEKSFEQVIENKWKKSFVLVFNLADAHIVLAKEFKGKLETWGICKDIYIETTKVDDNLLKGFSITNKNNRKHNILFLARIEREKGIIETIKCYEIIKKQIDNIKLTIAGDGSCLDAAKQYVQQLELKDVIFLGYVRNEHKINSFTNASIYILPTHGEGMPTSLLEAMAFGLPIIARPVGGIKDFFEDGKMGYIIEDPDPQKYAEAIINILKNPELEKEIRNYNYCYAKEHFLASKVAKRLEDIYTKIYYKNINQ